MLNVNVQRAFVVRVTIAVGLSLRSRVCGIKMPGLISALCHDVGDVFRRDKIRRIGIDSYFELYSFAPSGVLRAEERDIRTDLGKRKSALPRAHLVIETDPETYFAVVRVFIRSLRNGKVVFAQCIYRSAGKLRRSEIYFDSVADVLEFIALRHIIDHSIDFLFGGRSEIEPHVKHERSSLRRSYTVFEPVLYLLVGINDRAVFKLRSSRCVARNDIHTDRCARAHFFLRIVGYYQRALACL